MIINYHFPNDLIYHPMDNTFKDYSKKTVLKFMKTVYGSKENFKKQFLDRISAVQALSKIHDYLDRYYDRVDSMTFFEAFHLVSYKQKRAVFEKLDIGEMMKSLNAERVAVDGKEVIRKQYDENGQSMPDITYHSIFETYKVDFSPALANITDTESPQWQYAIKCWCTSTNKEHWIWIEEQYAMQPLEAIASTFRVHRQIIPHIKEIKRQGDILLVELKKEFQAKDFTPLSDVPAYENEIIPLTAEQYFHFLTAES